MMIKLNKRKRDKGIGQMRWANNRARVSVVIKLSAVVTLFSLAMRQTAAFASLAFRTNAHQQFLRRPFVKKCSWLEALSPSCHFSNKLFLNSLSDNSQHIFNIFISERGQRGPGIPLRSLSASASSVNESKVSSEEVDPGVVEGTELKILKYPHPALRAENSRITKEELESGEIAKLAKEMFLVMYAAQGVGLAAPQVGVNKRLMVYNPTGDSKKWLDETTLVNPIIVEYGEGKDIESEGCLSFPNMNGEVERSKVIKVEALNIKGKKIKRKFKGWEARIFQHEYDHLDGVVYIDRLTEEGREGVQPRLNELIADFGDGGAI